MWTTNNIIKVSLQIWTVLYQFQPDLDRSGEHILLILWCSAFWVFFDMVALRTGWIYYWIYYCFWYFNFCLLWTRSGEVPKLERSWPDLDKNWSLNLNRADRESWRALKVIMQQLTSSQQSVVRQVYPLRNIADKQLTAATTATQWSSSLAVIIFLEITLTCWTIWTALTAQHTYASPMERCHPRLIWQKQRPFVRTAWSSELAYVLSTFRWNPYADESKLYMDRALPIKNDGRTQRYKYEPLYSTNLGSQSLLREVCKPNLLMTPSTIMLTTNVKRDKVTQFQLIIR